MAFVKSANNAISMFMDFFCPWLRVTERLGRKTGDVDKIRPEASVSCIKKSKKFSRKRHHGSSRETESISIWKKEKLEECKQHEGKDAGLSRKHSRGSCHRGWCLARQPWSASCSPCWSLPRKPVPLIIWSLLWFNQTVADICSTYTNQKLYHQCKQPENIWEKNVKNYNFVDSSKNPNSPQI